MLLKSAKKRLKKNGQGIYRMETLGNKGNKKKHQKKYQCVLCDFYTSHKNDWNKHLMRAKHKKACGNARDNPKTHECKLCGKKFKTRSGKWKHEKKCDGNTDSSVMFPGFHKNTKKVDMSKIMSKNLEKQELEKLKEEIKKKDKKIEMLEKKQLQQEVEHLTKSLSARDRHIEDLKNHKGNTQNINTQNNNYINIQLYLDEKCSNAMPIMDFIEKLKFKLTDINPDRPNSSIESLTNMVVTELNQLDNTERPIHCSDAKRLNFYVKDASDGWINDKDNKKIDKAIGWANMRHQDAWHNYAKKEGIDSSKRKDTDYHKMNVAMAAWSDDSKKAKKKVKRAIAKATNFKEMVSP